MLLKKLVNWWYLKHPPEIVRYWKKKDKERAYLKREGYYQMQIDGEKYLYPGFPRGHLLSNRLSKLKHHIKNRFFNETWAQLEQGIEQKEILTRLKIPVLDEIADLIEQNRLLLLPPEKMVPPVQELWRVLSILETPYKAEKRRRLEGIKKTLCFVLQEDDAYRFRVQWLFGVFNPKTLWNRILGKKAITLFAKGLEFMEHAETSEDMKGRIRLLRRVLLLLLNNHSIKRLFDQMCHEINWNKLKLTDADRYFFRAKYFRVDLDKGFEY